MKTAARNSTFPQEPRTAAELYLKKGLAPIPMPSRSKDPGYSEWQNLRASPETLNHLFPPHQRLNTGILNGRPSKRHHDVDLDCPQALQAAPLLLPPTGWIFGRPSSPRSHWIYQTDRCLDTAQLPFADLDKSMLVELRGTGGLTVFPPSMHKETGEAIRWDEFTRPGKVLLGDLENAVARLAAPPGNRSGPNCARPSSSADLRDHFKGMMRLDPCGWRPTVP
jgi:hypothetical protein